MYESVAKPLLFRLSPEVAHKLTMGALRAASASSALVGELRRHYGGDDPRLAVSAFGLTFPNPIGLAAGLDKDGVAIPALAALGFGSLEVGSVTAIAQPGNPPPRLYRLPDDEALINRMGFNNHGARALARRLEALAALPPNDRRRPQVPIGVNVGKSRAAPAADAEQDYLAALRTVWRHADYVVFNVSSPNTPGLRDLQEREPLTRLLRAARLLAEELGPLPVLVKLSPDLAREQLQAAADVARDNGAAGLIATNTTVSRPSMLSAGSGPAGGYGTGSQGGSPAGQAGGLSGRPLAELAITVLRELRGLTDLPIVSVGGISSVSDVLERLRLGAVLVQLYTSFVYKGPALLSELKSGLVAELEASGAADLATWRADNVTGTS